MARLLGLGVMSVSSATQLVLWGGVTVVGVAGVLVSANSVRFQRRVHEEARRALQVTAPGRHLDRSALETLPAPVRRYLSKAVGTRQAAARTAKLQQQGSFRPDLKGQWYEIRGEQYFTADPPGFIWWGRVRITPG